MTADIDADGLLLECQKCLLVILAHIRERDMEVVLFLLRGDVKEAHLAFHDRLFLFCLSLQKVAGDDKLLLSRSWKCVQGTRFNEALQRSLIDFLVGHSGHKIIEVFEETAALTLGDDHVHHGPAHTLDGGKSVTDPVSGYREAAVSLVDIRRQDRDSHVPAGENVLGDLRGVVHHGGHERRHEFLWIIIF